AVGGSSASGPSQRAEHCGSDPGAGGASQCQQGPGGARERSADICGTAGGSVPGSRTARGGNHTNGAANCVHTRSDSGGTQECTADPCPCRASDHVSQSPTRQR